MKITERGVFFEGRYKNASVSKGVCKFIDESGAPLFIDAKTLVAAYDLLSYDAYDKGYEDILENI